MGQAAITVAVVEGQVATREGIVGMVASDDSFEIVAQVATIDELVRSGASYDVCVLELLGTGSELDLIRMLTTHQVVVFTAVEHWRVRIAAWVLGAHGVLGKSVGRATLIDAITQAHQAGPAITTHVAGALTEAVGRGVIELTDQQRRLVDSLAYGRRLGQLLADLALSPAALAEQLGQIRTICRRAGLHGLHPEAQPSTGSRAGAPPAGTWRPELAKRLTPSQLDVLALLADGYTVREIAQQRDRSEHTVRHQIGDALAVAGIYRASSEQRLLFAVYVTGRHRYPDRLWERLAVLTQL